MCDFIDVLIKVMYEFYVENFGRLLLIFEDYVVLIMNDIFSVGLEIIFICVLWVFVYLVLNFKV